MQWLDEVRQTATLDEAEQLAVRLGQKPFESAREAYAQVNFDIPEFALGVTNLVTQARRARASAIVAQNRYELESGDRRAVVAEVAKWLEQLHMAGRYAKANKHPLGQQLPKLLFTSEVSAETWSQSRDGMLPVLDNVADLGDLTEIGLPADFHARGVALYERLGEERDDAVFAESSRFIATGRLEALLDQIVEQFERIVAARDLYMSLYDEDLPGLELSLVKSAAAPRPARRAPETTPPVTPTPAVEPPTTDEPTGL
jgi:hypothetical protein